MLLCKWDVSAAIHIHVILADINREDERFLLGARLHPSVLLTCEREGYFSTSLEELGGWPRRMGSSLRRAVSRSFYLVDPLYGTVQVCVCRSHWFTRWRQMPPFNVHIYPLEIGTCSIIFPLALFFSSGGRGLLPPSKYIILKYGPFCFLDFELHAWMLSIYQAPLKHKW